MNLIQKVSTFGTAMLCAATLYAGSTPDNKHNNKKTVNNEKNINYDKAIAVKGEHDKAYTEAVLSMNNSTLKETAESKNEIKNFSDFVSAFMLEDSYDYETIKDSDIDESLMSNCLNDNTGNSKEDSVKYSEINDEKLKMPNPDNIKTTDSVERDYRLFSDED